MKIAITGEGPTDYGKEDFDTRRREKVLIRGASEGFVERLTDEGTDIEWHWIDRKAVEKYQFQGRRLNELNLDELEGKGIQAARFISKLMTESFLENYDLAIYYCDSDRDARTKNSSMRAAVNRFEKVYAQVEKGLETGKDVITAIPMIPIRIVENWILADSKNLTKVFHLKAKVEDFKNVELLWGDQDNPESDYPKCVLERIRGQADERYRTASPYEIALSADPEVIRKKCPHSFGRFYDDLISAIR